jgi:hypothetical protein
VKHTKQYSKKKDCAVAPLGIYRMRILSSLSRRVLPHRSTGRGFDRRLLWNRLHICCWIQLFSLSVTRPISALPVPFDLHRGPTYSNSVTIMPEPARSMRTTTTFRLEATKAADDESAEEIELKAPRRSLRKRTRGSTDTAEEAEAEEEAESSTPKKPKAVVKRKSPTKKASKAKGATGKVNEDIEESDVDGISSDAAEGKSTKKKSPVKKKKKAPSKAKGAGAKAPKDVEDDDDDDSASDAEGKTKKKKSPAKKKKSPTKKKASDHQRITERDDLPKLWDAEKALAEGSYSTCDFPFLYLHENCKLPRLTVLSEIM